MRIVLFFVISTVISACAYHLGDYQRSLPGGYDRVAIPMFSNLSDEVGLEPYFTDSLIRKFERSKVAKVTDKVSAPVVLEGTVETVEYVPNAQIKAGPDNTLPVNTVLTTDYRVKVKARLTLKRNSDNKVIWSQVFESEKVYQAPQLGTQFVNSANATYNHSARHQSISDLAQVMMEEAHDRLTENF